MTVRRGLAKPANSAVVARFMAREKAREQELIRLREIAKLEEVARWAAYLRRR